MKGTHFVLITLLFLFSCQKNELPDPGQYDAELEALLIRQGGVDRFRIPDSDDFDKIPQDPLNPITSAKVQLGQKLFHETMIAVNPRMPVSMGTYSCASCHHQAAGFQAGIKQGIGEGGTGFGVAGEGRLPAANFPFDSLDVQPIRSPSVLNTAFQEVMLWNGQFGATGLNEGTRYAWKEGTPIATNQLGYEGLEIQAIAGMGVHRLDIKQPDFTGNDYAALFAEAFPNMSLEEMYSKEAAGLAIAAYERTVLANEAPFQSWLKGEKAAMNDQEKRGALLFFGDAGCVNCHNTAGLSGRSFA
ncbi:MAG: cytochrome c peroxidase, partial [Bacteroidota bacterium]